MHSRDDYGSPKNTRTSQFGEQQHRVEEYMRKFVRVKSKHKKPILGFMEVKRCLKGRAKDLVECLGPLDFLASYNSSGRELFRPKRLPVSPN